MAKRTPIVSKTMFSIVPARTMRVKLAPSDYQVLIALSSMTNRYGICFPSGGKLSAFTGVAEAQVRKSVVKLVRQRLVRRLKSKHVHGLKRLGRYQVLCLAPDQPMPTKEEVWSQSDISDGSFGLKRRIVMRGPGRMRVRRRE